MLTWKATHWSPIALALAFSLHFAGAANASIQLLPVANFHERELVLPQDDSSSSNPDSGASAAADDSEGESESSREIERLWHASNSSSTPASGSSSSTPGAGGITVCTLPATSLPDLDDRVERLVCVDSNLSRSEFVSRLLRPPRIC